MHRASSGFTYIELIITISIIALTLAFVAPSLETYSQSQKVKNTAREIYTNLQLARMAAIEENKTVDIIFSLNPAAAMSIQDSTGRDVIPRVDFQDSTPDVKLTSNLCGANAGKLTYQPMGNLKDGAQTITVGLRQTVTEYEVKINPVGGLRLVKK
ncbi:MAG: prepilin-type N-terminal cleavage/methylation domain-containing protein [Deltaproteobacteria bacterium]|nr:prepilin-type N-terminal cleavage/methylation domain-containing protein [Deltaproteobacteria bacterium]